MASKKQVAANRRNALKHGLSAENAVITGDDEEAFDELRNTFLDQFRPATPLETGRFELCLAYVFPDSTATRRYKARIERSFYSALRELQRLQPARQRPDPPPPPSMSVSPDEPIKLLKTMDRILEEASTNPYHPETELNLIPSRAGASACPPACPGLLPRPAAASVVL